jgi:L-aminopeptidase/D-esterase-like protein
VAVNAFGDVIDPVTSEILAGVRKLGADQPADTLEVMRGLVGRAALSFASSTVIGVVATNARLTKEEANKVAQMAHDGIARTVRPSHTMFDGDTLFVLAMGKKRADVNLIGAYATEVVAEAVIRGVRAAEGAGGLPAHRELRWVA